MGQTDKNIQFLMVDLFCGAGGTTIGAEMSDVCKVIAAINHDPIAISSHQANHENVFHITEDILIADLQQLIEVVNYWKAIYPNAKLIVWASVDCTNHSGAKGGLPRDADDRALADGLPRYIIALDPEYFFIENVKEFMAWGPMVPKVVKSKEGDFCPLRYKDDKPGPHLLPESRTAGKDYIRWVKSVQALGYKHDWRMINAADLGGVTIRERYFGAFYKPGMPFAWPQRTHAKKAAKGNLFQDEMKPWRPVSEILDFSNLGKSIFDRKKPLVDKTLRRILSGLEKFHGEQQIMVCNSPGYCVPVTRPIGALTTVPSKALLTPFLMRYNGKGIGQRINEPSGTLTTRDRFGLISPFIYRDFGNATNQSVNKPAGAITVNPKLNLCTPWIDRDFRSGRYQSVTQPAGAILTVPKMNLCTAFLVPSNFDNTARSIDCPAPTILASRKHINLATAFLVNPQYNNKGNSIHKPAPTIIAQQKSYPLSMATATAEGEPKWTVTNTDSQAMIELKTFMRENGIADVFMRMLMVKELKLIQGFPEKYILHGKITDKKKFIGNSVETGIVNHWLRAIATESNQYQNAQKWEQIAV